MSQHMAYFLGAVSIFVLGIAAVVGYYLIQSRRKSQSTWRQLLSELASVNRLGIETVARDLIDAEGAPRSDNEAKSLRPEQIWQLVGGMDGLETLERNSQVLIRIAAYARKWHPEAESAAEPLRLKAREIEWQLSRLRAAEQREKLEGWFANYAQSAVATYYLMTRQVLALCEGGPLPMMSEVQEAL